MSEAIERWVSTLEGERAGPAWLAARRGDALGRFRERGFPTRREEAWKYTNPQRITSVSYCRSQAADLEEAALDALTLVPQDGPRAVFVNGRLHTEASTLETLPKGLRCDLIGSASGEHDGALSDALATTAALADRSFAALADAFFEDGCLLRADPGVQLEEPFNLIFLSVEENGSEGPTASHPRVWVRAGAGSALAVREVFLSLDESEHLTNVVSQYHAEPGAALSRTAIQVESQASTFLATVAIHAERDSRVAQRAFSIGAGLAREDTICELAGSGAECDLRGLYVTREGQHSDHHTTVEHLVPHCSSQQLYRGVLAGRSRGAFTGKVVVRPGAQKSDARQKNESLLLSEHAEADSKPQLEIYADDVKCSHGSTIGQLDPDQVFYLRSRGIDDEGARSILVRGFASAISVEIDDPVLRDAVDTEISKHLEGGGLR